MRKVIPDYRQEKASETMNVVADTNLVSSAIFWPGDSPGCFVLWARPRFHLAISVPIVEEDANNTSR